MEPSFLQALISQRVVAVQDVNHIKLGAFDVTWVLQPSAVLRLVPFARDGCATSSIIDLQYPH